MTVHQMLQVADRPEVWHQCRCCFHAGNTAMANSSGRACAWLTLSSGTTPASILASIGTLHQHRAAPESHQISSCLILCLWYALAPTTDWASEKGQKGCLAEASPQAFLPCSSYTCHMCKLQYSQFAWSGQTMVYIGSPKLA